MPSALKTSEVSKTSEVCDCTPCAVPSLRHTECFYYLDQFLKCTASSSAGFPKRPRNR